MSRLKNIKDALARLPMVYPTWKLIKRNIRILDIYRQYFEFKKIGQKRFAMNWSDRFFCPDDSTSETSFDGQYIYHPAWAARVLSKTKPVEHVDISSTLHFCTIVSAFVPVRFYDYRPAKLNLKGLTSERGDLMALPFKDSSIESLSCMHVIEHIGLGRYGDSLDPDGDLKAITELKRVLKPDGNLLFVVPVADKAKIVFNAHRIYTYSQIVEYFRDMKLINFALLDIKKGFIDPATELDTNNLEYGMGCWWFKKEA